MPTDDLLWLEQGDSDRAAKRYVATRERFEHGRRVNYQLVAAGGTLSEQTLDNATAPQSGRAIDFRTAVHRLALQVCHTGAPDGVTVYLEGSINGHDWVALGKWWSHEQDNGAIITVEGPPVVHARAVLKVLAGGKQPSVSAWICAV